MGEETERAGQKARPALKGLSHKTKAFASEVYAAVRSGELAQPFSREAAKRACPGRSESTYRNFFNKYRVGNPGGMAELFVRRAWNRFEIIDSTETRPASRERKLDEGEPVNFKPGDKVSLRGRRAY